MDHILGVAHNKVCLKGKTWIAPDIKKLYSTPPISASRLFNYLVRVGKSQVILIDTHDLNKEFYKSTYLSMYLGTPHSSTYTTIGNNGGLILKLECSRKMLFPGDCENKYIPPQATADIYDYILITHHGAKMGTPNVRGTNISISSAFISRGNKNGTFVPEEKIKSMYKNRGFKHTRRTYWLKKNSYYKIKL